MARLWLASAYHGVYINLTVVDLSNRDNITIQVANMPVNLIPEGRRSSRHIQEIQLAKLSAEAWDFFWPIPNRLVPVVRDRPEAAVLDASAPEAPLLQNPSYSSDTLECHFFWPFRYDWVATAPDQPEALVPDAPPPQASILQDPTYISDTPRGRQDSMDLQIERAVQRPPRQLAPRLSFPLSLPRAP